MRRIRKDREIAYDRKREIFLKTEGYQIVRVQNDDVYKHINDVLDMILMGLEEGFSAGGNTAALRFAALIRPSGTPDQVRGRLFSRERAREKGKCCLE